MGCLCAYQAAAPAGPSQRLVFIAKAACGKAGAEKIVLPCACPEISSKTVVAWTQASMNTAHSSSCLKQIVLQPRARESVGGGFFFIVCCNSVQAVCLNKWAVSVQTSHYSQNTEAKGKIGYRCVIAVLTDQLDAIGTNRQQFNRRWYLA